ncbi:amidohydrolase family protein [Saliphagus sp. GCM10025334]
MVKRIDAFAHVLPRTFYDRMMEVHPTDELEALGEVDYFWDLETRLSDMDEFGIDKQVLTIARPPIWRGIDPDDALEMTQVANDAVREYSDQAADRFIAVGTLPRLDDEYLDEAKRIVEDLDMAGIQVFSNTEGEPIDSEAAEEIFAYAAEQGAPIWLHPQLHEWHDWDDQFMLHKMLGWPFDTSIAMCRLVYSGIMERHPDLAVIPHHMGAMIPHFQDRMQLFSEMLVENRDVYPYPVPDFEEPPIEYFKNFYADTVRSGGTNVVEDGLEFYGDDHLLFATDYPFGPENGRAFMREESRAVEEMDISESKRNRVWSENFKSLMG